MPSVSVYAGRISDPPRDYRGQPIPNATFQLYLPGTKTAPTYYTDRLKTDTVSGDPTTDELGNTAGWVEPGIYEYWYNGRLILDDFQVVEDNGEDDAALEAAKDEIDDELETRPTFDEMTEAIQSGGGLVVGAELQANKNQVGGYAGLDGSGVVADAQLPASAKTATRIPTAHASTHELGGDDVVSVPGIWNYVLIEDDYTASPGDFISIDDGPLSNINVTMPPVGLGQAAIGIQRPGVNTTLTIVDDEASYVIDSTFMIVNAILLVSGAEIWNVVLGINDSLIGVKPLVNNDLQGGTLIGVKEVVIPITGTTYTYAPAGQNEGQTGGDCGLTFVYTNTSADGIFHVPETALPGDNCELIQYSTKKLKVVADGNAVLLEADGHNRTAKNGTALRLKCIANSDNTHAVWHIAGYGDTAP